MAEDTAFLTLAFGFAFLSIGLGLLRFALDAMLSTRVLSSAIEDEDEPRRLDSMRITVMLLSSTAEAGFALTVFLLYARAVGGGRLTALAAGLSILTIAVVLVGFCRILPRVTVTRDPGRFLRPLLPGVRVASLLMFPIVVVLRWWQRVLSRGEATSLDDSFTEEIRARVAAGERDGVVAEDTAEMIENVVEFRDVEVSEAMTPRTDVHWVKADASAMESLKIAASKGHSRLPVGEEDSDHIVGVFYVRDVISHMENPEVLQSTLTRDLCRKPYFVPESKSVKALLQEFRESKIHIAIVLDEYGGTAGLVTIEDILEEIVGDIDDEYDDEERPPALKMVGEDKAEVDARLHIDDINDALEIDLPESEDFDTVGGFVFARLGRIPRAGDRVTYEGIDIEVLEADDRRVKRVNLTVNGRTNGDGHAQAS